MKCLLVFALSILATPCAYSQSCSGNPPIVCSGEKIVSPAVRQPVGAKLVSATCTTLVIKWTGAPGQDYLVKLMYKNDATNSVDTITGTNITCDANNNCTATIPVVAGVKYWWSVEAKSIIGSCSFYSYPVSGQLQYPIAACNQAGNTITFKGKVMLQGAYNSSTGSMSNDLNTTGVLQSYAASQPYHNATFNYSGTESVGTGFFAAHPDIVDWVLIELRDANAPATIVATRAAFVTQDGSLVETDGSSHAIAFQNIANNYYHVVIKHRNHLAIRTADPVDFINGYGEFDFTTANFKSFKNQNYTSTVQMGNVWLMRGGNTKGSTVVKYTGPGNDQNQILNIRLGGSLSLIVNNVYAAEDVNMNGNIKWSGPGNDQNFLLNVALSGSLSAILVEQLY